MTKPQRMVATVTGICVLFCAVFPFVIAPIFEKMFRDYYGLPALTELGLTTWFPLVLAAVPAAVLGLALVASRRLLWVACALSIAAALVCTGSMVLPSLQSEEPHSHG